MYKDILRHFSIHISMEIASEPSMVPKEDEPQSQSLQSNTLV